jgi:hypothetical protein
MKTVFKYELNPVAAEDLAVLEMPEGAEPLEVGFQGSQLCLWALVDPEVTGREQFTFIVKGTDHEGTDEQMNWETYVGTAIHPQIRLVVHVFCVEVA